ASRGGPWKRIGYNISDAETADRPLFHDRRAEIGSTWYYRVRARNAAGLSTPSNIVGPVTARHKTLVDECWNFAIAFSRKGDLSLETADSRLFKEDAHRIAGKPGAELVYYIPGPLQTLKFYLFAVSADKSIEISLSTDGEEYTPLQVEARDFFAGAADYEYLRPLLFASSGLPAGIHYVRVAFLGEAQLGRAELIYGK
ncbi:MAG TPA: hypothetical protein PKI81_07480, partial [bacterium]|nr:hypothetical protein [bacterium]